MNRSRSSSPGQLLHQDSVLEYFNSENYQSLDCIQRRKQSFERGLKLRNNSNSDEKRNGKHERIVREQQSSGVDSRRIQKKTRPFGLRRPLSPSVTSEDIRGNSVSHEEFADKPYSTVMSKSGPMEYDDCFPLLMARSTKAEDKDFTQVQTETRRMSVVTTNYETGTIELKGAKDGEDIKLKVFPLLHKDVVSDSDEAEETVDEKDSANKMTPMFRKETLSSAISDTDEMISDWNTLRRRSPFSRGVRWAKNSAAETQATGTTNVTSTGSKVARRKSVDPNAISAVHFRALKLIQQRMRSQTVKEEPDEDDDGSMTEKDEYHLRHAESTMLHLDRNLKTLEKFLRHIESTLDKEEEEWDPSMTEAEAIAAERGFLESSSDSDQGDGEAESDESDEGRAKFW